MTNPPDDIQIDLNQTDVLDPGSTIGSHYDQLMEDTQGNILKGHGRNHAKHLFLGFAHADDGDRAAVGAWLSALAKNYVTSAWKQYEDTQAHKKKKAAHVAESSAPYRDDGDGFVSISLAAGGYAALGVEADDLPTDPTYRQGAKPGITVFEGAGLNDPPVDEWEAVYRRDIDALLQMAHDEPDALKALVEAIEATMPAQVQILGSEDGIVLRNEEGEVTEPFGYRDGLSQPLFLHGDLDAVRRSGGFSRYDASAPLGLVLSKDPLGGPYGYGSYMVYRKLGQDVDGFHAGVEKLADQIRKDRQTALGGKEPIDPPPTREEDIERAGAYAVGRFRDGTPVVLQGAPGMGPATENWNYIDDPYGAQCPFQAHTRKTNPRGDTQREFAIPPGRDRPRRIARRAIYFKHDEAPAPETGWDEYRKTGLLFMCYQSNIANQFGFLQVRWANNDAFLLEGSGLDAIVGQGPADQPAAEQPWPLTWGLPASVVQGGGTTSFNLSGYVRMLGGEFFFTPSLSFLKGCG